MKTLDKTMGVEMNRGTDSKDLVTSWIRAIKGRSGIAVTF